MEKPVRWIDYLTTNIYFFGLTTLSQTMGLVYPLLIQNFLGEAQQGTYLGSLRLWSLMIALLMQAFWGMLSDRSKFSLGKRRPFILTGTLLDVVFILAIALLVTAEGMTGYILLFIFAILLQISSNMAHAAAQGLIPDRIPEELRGRFSGVKAVLEIPLPVILVALVIGTIVKNGNIPGALAMTIWILLITMGITMLVSEKRLEGNSEPLDWGPFLRLLAMTALFTMLILGVGTGVKWIGNLMQPASSIWQSMLSTGLAGTAGMLIAVAFGVRIGMRVSLGKGSLADRNFTWWVISRLAFLVGIINLSSFAVFYFQKRLGFSGMTAAGPAAQLLQVVGVMIFLSALPSGWLADRFGHKRILVASGITACLGTVLVLLTTHMTVIFTGGAIIGLAAGLFYSANWALGTSLAPKDQAARYLGLSNLAGAGAGAIGAYIGGPIADSVTAQVPGIPGAGYLLLFTIYAFLFLFSVIAIAQIKEF